MTTMAVIYAITNSIARKVYIGSTVRYEQRIYRHKRELLANEHHSQKLQNSWNKHGASAFSFSVLENVSDRTALMEREQFWIDSFDSARAGYNMAPSAGSLRGFKASEETKARISAGVKKSWTPEKIALISERVVSAETRKKMSASAKAAKQSAEVRKAISEKSKGRVMSAESNEKRRIAHTGKVMSPESRAKMSEAQKRLATPEKRLALSKMNKGREVSDETKKKLSAMRRGVPKSDAHRAAMSLAAKNRYAKLREEKARLAQA